MSAAAPLRAFPAIAVACALCLAATSGCIPLAMMAANELLGGRGGPAQSGDATPYGGPDTAAQNGRHDPTIAEALRASDTGISEECRMALAQPEAGTGPADVRRASGEVSGEASGPAPACSRQPVCLPGFSKPVPMRLCAVPGRL